MNLFVALAPVTKLHNTTVPFLTYLAKAVNIVQDAFDFAHVYDLFGPDSALVTKIVCGILPDFCRLLQLFVASHDPLLDDEDRF